MRVFLFASIVFAVCVIVAAPSTGWAQASQTQQSGLMSSFGLFVPMLLVFGVFYFLMIRPQQKRMREHRAKVAGARRGDRVLTGGGLFGTVVSHSDNVMRVQLAEGFEVEVAPQTLSDVLGPDDKFNASRPVKNSKKKKSARAESSKAESSADPVEGSEHEEATDSDSGNSDESEPHSKKP